jgi:hypothetical protein
MATSVGAKVAPKEFQITSSQPQTPSAYLYFHYEASGYLSSDDDEEKKPSSDPVSRDAQPRERRDSLFQDYQHPADTTQPFEEDGDDGNGSRRNSLSTSSAVPTAQGSQGLRSNALRQSSRRIRPEAEAGRQRSADDEEASFPTGSGNADDGVRDEPTVKAPPTNHSAEYKKLVQIRKQPPKMMLEDERHPESVVDLEFAVCVETKGNPNNQMSDESLVSDCRGGGVHGRKCGSRRCLCCNDELRRFYERYQIQPPSDFSPHGSDSKGNASSSARRGPGAIITPPKKYSPSVSHQAHPDQRDRSVSPTNGAAAPDHTPLGNPASASGGKHSTPPPPIAAGDPTVKALFTPKISAISELLDQARSKSRETQESDESNGNSKEPRWAQLYRQGKEFRERQLARQQQQEINKRLALEAELQHCVGHGIVRTDEVFDRMYERRKISGTECGEFHLHGSRCNCGDRRPLQTTHKPETHPAPSPNGALTVSPSPTPHRARTPPSTRR